jgi:glycosyltransferase involved in cell wall biosynthesis
MIRTIQLQGTRLQGMKGPMTPTRRKPAKHYRMSARVAVWMILLAWVELLRHLPSLLSLRRSYLTRGCPSGEPAVALVGDNLDERNGIAISVRRMVRLLHRQGRKAYVVGAVSRTKRSRLEPPDGNVLMLPVGYSAESPGYSTIEATVPRIELALRLLRRYPVDLIEVESPSFTGSLAYGVGGIVGIPTVTHYRTDLLSYYDILFGNRLGARIARMWTVFLLRTGGPVIVPSEAFRQKVAELGVPPDRIFRLPRGVDLEQFRPDRCSESTTPRRASRHQGARLVYAGRISKEKNLEFLADAFEALVWDRPDVTLTVLT